MRKDLITLTREEHERLQIIRRVMKRELRQKEAGELLGVTDRQVRNLVRKVKEKGVQGMAHGNRGKPSPRRLPKQINLEEIFCLKASRTIHNGYFIRWKGKRYSIQEPSRRMKRRPALVIEHFDGRMIIRFEGKDLRYREIEEREKSPKSGIGSRPKPPKYIPPPDHPWRRLFSAPSQSSSPERI